MTTNQNTRGQNINIKSHDYNPYDHRETRRPLSNLAALVLLTKGAIGMGIVSASLIYKEGYLTGIIYTCVIGVLITHCLHILFRSQYRLCRRLKVPVLSYSESMKKALETGPRRLRVLHRYAPYNFYVDCNQQTDKIISLMSNSTGFNGSTMSTIVASYSLFIVDSSTLLCQFTICTSYALFILQTFGFFEMYTTWMNIGLERPIYCVLLIAPFILILYLGNWKIAVYVSIAASLASIFSLAIFASYIFEDQKSLYDLRMVGDVSQLPNFFGPVLFSLEAVTVVTTFEKHLQSPKHFFSSWGTLNIGMALITISYILVGVLGYWKYGEFAVGSFMNDLPLKDSASIWCRCLYTIAIYLSYGLHGFVLVDVLWMKKWRGHDLKFKHFFRVAFVIGSTLIIIFVPFIVRTVILDALLALSLPILGIVLPALMEFCVEWPTHHEKRILILWKDALFILVGLVDAFVGIYFCVTQLIQFFAVNRDPFFW